MDRLQELYNTDMTAFLDEVQRKDLPSPVLLGVTMTYTKGWWDAAKRLDTVPKTVIAAEIPPTVAHHVIWHYGRASSQAGYEPGDFVAALLQTISRADDSNRFQLAKAFPEYVAAATLMERDVDGFDMLHRQAMREASQ